MRKRYRSHRPISSHPNSRLGIEALEGRELLCATALTADSTCPEPAVTLDLNGDGRINAADAVLINDVIDDPQIRDQVLIGDANLSGGVGFDDFLIMASNFGQSGQHYGDGDFNASGDVGFADFLLLSANFGAERTYKLPTPVEPIDPVFEELPCGDENVECLVAGQESYLQEELSTPSTTPKIFYVHPDMAFNHLDIKGRNGDEIHFLPGSQIIGSVKATGPWNADRGVVNIEASSDLLITGLNATNEYQYQVQNNDGDEQSSTALNISWSHNVELRDSVLKGNGKLTTWIQGDSTVELNNTEIDCYYFCVGIAASDVTSKDLVINQNNEVVPGDLHAAMWISSTMRAPDNTFYGNSSVSFTDTTINKQTGEAIIVGNGGYDYRSNVEMTGDTIVNASGRAALRQDGWLAIHPNYFGISLFLEDNYPTTNVEFARDAAPNEFGRFIMHAGGTEGGPEESPLIVCVGDSCISTNDQ